MSKESHPSLDLDPGGNTCEVVPGLPTSRELTDLKDQNEQQQLLIAQLKEMLRKEQSNVTQEKVEEYINTLSKMKDKKIRAKKDDSTSLEKSGSSSTVGSNKKQKVHLLKQQLEENKARLAERGKNRKGIEEMVNQLKAQLNDSQQLIHATPVNTSVVENKNMEYNKNSSQEELYNILLLKEKLIIELSTKTQKQEATIIDIKENLKEKDSVIDARTKAITLMTDNLSKKGKDTLDALDDTKEQMRKMQENFITLEAEMKARQMKLLSDLKAKNLEIAELQECNQKLMQEKNEYLKHSNDSEKREELNSDSLIKDLQEKLNLTTLENNENLVKISDLETKLQASLEDINRLKNVSLPMEMSENNDTETIKLKKQLEESNKNMIKIKAQSKSKIKELNKTIDTFKKMSDANMLVVQLQTENTKLSEKIAELEEEKGNMQLKMVESTVSTKDYVASNEDFKDMQEKLLNNSVELNEKNKIISLLESDIISLKEQISSQNEKISEYSHLENVQVTTEIKSIQIEEQLDKLENENLKLNSEMNKILKEKEELVNKVEELVKEKQELSAKLDSYVQENMELIDKLEKLSAEKVSSVESIEIVEGLTQQEKLELAAYQKNVDVSLGANVEEPIKCSEYDNIEPPPELSESVLQLREDSAELLQKIEMFNMERKEVMLKMEALKEENNGLNLKINEIENNRDILAETYEQLQNEKDELEKQYEQLLQKVEKQEIEHGSLDKVESDPSDQLEELRKNYEEILAENNHLKHKLKDFDSTIHEKDDLEVKLTNSKTKIDELETKVKINLEEISNYQNIIEENKNEIIVSAKLINDLQSKLNDRENDIKYLNVLINDLNNAVSNLQQENEKLGNFEVMEMQVNELKTALNGHIEQAQDYAEEIAHNNNMITDLKRRLAEMDNKILETEHEIEMRDVELKKMQEDIFNRDEIIRNLQHQIQEKDQKMNIVEEIKQKYLELQKQLNNNNGFVEKKMEELANKNKEQLEKMKKIAANLRKKTQSYQELEEKYNGDKEKWEIERNEIEGEFNNKITDLISQITYLKEDVHLKTVELETSTKKVQELTAALNDLEQIRVELQNTVMEMQHKHEKLNEVSLKKELSTSLHQEFDYIHGNNDSTNEEKIKELELIIETNEGDLNHYKERIQKLEEDISRLIEEKETLEQNSKELHEKVNLTSKIIEEKAGLEEELANKLVELGANNEIFMKRLEEMSAHNNELNQKNKEQEESISKLKTKIKKSHEKVNQLKDLQPKIEELESVNGELLKQIAHLDTCQRNTQVENEALQKQNQRDYEKIEAEYQTQLELLNESKNELTVECEKLREDVKNRLEKEEECLAEINEYKRKMEEIGITSSNQILQLTEDLSIATSNWNNYANQVDILKKELADLQKQLVVQVAKETVENVLADAKDVVFEMTTRETQTEEEELVNNETQQSVNAPTNHESNTIPTFHWPNTRQLAQNQEWFGSNMGDQRLSEGQFFTEENSVKLNSGYPPKDSVWPEGQWFTEENSAKPTSAAYITRENLISKIKALELLLYNVDKEKEEVLKDCTGMIDELTHLVYEKVSMPAPKVIHSSTVSQIESAVDSQIMSPAAVAAVANNKKELRQIEFEDINPLFGQQTHPVIEEVVRPKKAYLTYQPGVEAFGENDDGWGWGPEEAKLEEEHLHRTESTPQVQNLKVEVAHLNEKLQVLQVERDNHFEEIKQLQIKSGKLIKKCKELKQKNDQLMAQKVTKKSESVKFFDLDETIQEELKMQIAQLEKKIKEAIADLTREKAEKANILKRVDVLTSANERMLEIKEVQDTEILRWKRKFEEVEEKSKQHECGSDGFNEGSKPQQLNVLADGGVESIEELKNTIRELSLDNEELQSLLNEQRQLRIDAEKNKSFEESNEMFKLSTDFENKIQSLEVEISNKNLEIEAILVDKENIISQLQRALIERENTVQEMIEKSKSLSEKNRELEVALVNQNELIKHLEKEVNNSDQQKLSDNSHLDEHKIKLETLVNEKDEALTRLKLSYDQVMELNNSLGIQTEMLTNDLEELRQKYNELETSSAQNILEMQNELVQEKERNDQLQTNINELEQDLAERKLKYNELQTSSARHIVDLQKEFEQLSQKCDKLQANMNWLEQEVVEWKQKYNELQTESTQNIAELQSELEQQKQSYSKLKTETESYINEMEQRLAEEKEKYLDFQVNNSQNMAEIQSKLEQEIMKYSQLQLEQSSEISRLEQELLEQKQKYSDLQIESDLTAEELKQLSSGKDDGLSLRIQQLESLLAEKDASLKEVRALLEDSNSQKVLQDEEIQHMKLAFEEKQKEYDLLVVESNEKLARTLAELEQKWEAQVDERGNTVAESWKYHLEMVEAGFTATQEKLKNEINELEEKCNALVNENNELRRNVDTEIKHEVDRISALQQQINDRQHSINELNQALVDEQSEKISLKETLAALENENDHLQKQNSSKDSELLGLKLIIETTQKQFDEKRELVEEIVKILEKNTSWPLSCEKQDLLTELQRQLNVVLQRDQQIVELDSQITKLQSQFGVVQEKDAEIFRLSELVNNLQIQLNFVHEKDQEIYKLKQTIEDLQKQTKLLQEKEDVILKLNEIIEEYKVNRNANQQDLHRLQQEKNDMSCTIEEYKQKLEEFKLTHIAIQNSLEDKNQQLKSLKDQLQLTENLKKDNNKDKEKLENELSQVKQEYSLLHQSLAECQHKLFICNQDLAAKTDELDHTKQEMVYINVNYGILDTEYNKLSNILQMKEEEYATSLENLRKNKLTELESHYREMLAIKDNDIQTLRTELSESLLKTQKLVEQIDEEIRSKLELENQIRQLQEKLTEQSALQEEENKQLTDLRGIIEQQVVKIEELKKELFEKSNDFDSFIAEMDIGRKAITQQPAPSASENRLISEDLSDPVSRAELDLALYMLHQRDVRCEELTVELTQLLEERDTLQLRLSNAIREKEDIRRKVTGVAGSGEVPTSFSSPEPVTPHSKSSAIFLAASGTELATEPLETSSTAQNLASKLSELKSVGYKKDKTFVDEQQLRRFQQMSIMQQHINEASKLPPEAAAKLVDASYTLSRDVQSPSKVLLNWLWGKSTPKVNDT